MVERARGIHKMFMLIGLGVFVLVNFIIVSKYEHEIKRADKEDKQMSKYIIEIEDEPVGKDIFNIIDISKMAITKESLDKLEKYEESEEREKSSRFKPVLQKKYYFIRDNGAIQSTIFTNTRYDIWRYKIGNCFKTYEKAEFELERLKVIAELKEFAEGDDAVWDGHNKHYILGFDTVELNINFNVYLKSGNLYFSSEEIAQKAIDTIGADRIKKYYLRVKE